MNKPLKNIGIKLKNNMDSLKSLLDQKKYDLVIKLTETSTSSSDLFYRISAFIFLGKYEDALYVIQDHQKTLESNLVALINAHINLLCVLNRFDQAYSVLDYYSNLPYQSQIVEETLRKMPEVIASEEKKQNSIKYYDDDQLLEMLSSGEDEQILLALDVIKSRDIFTFLPKLSSLLVNYHRETIKSYILMLLVQKELDRNLKINKLGQVIDVNPKYLHAPFSSPTFNEVVRYFDHELKNLSLSQTATQLFSQYCIYIYPKELEKDAWLYTLVFKDIASEYMSSTLGAIEINSICEEHNISLDEYELLKTEVNKILADF